ncbi:MAG: VWA domain-containing protein [Xanthomonadaceae bacterium]|nr:VWA domain-containing protein [Xanthomonadaceae bacterium]
MNEVIQSFHFLRPLWLLALLLLPLVVWRSLRGNGGDGAIRQWIDAPLREQVLIAGTGSKRLLAPLWLASVWAIAVIALAGPAWRQQSVALYQVQAPLVVVLDLSSHMAADDIAPDRITRARYKLMTLLKEREGGQVALIAYAGDAFTVAPMTDDAATVIALIDSLSPALMPVDGQRADRALRRAAALLAGAGFNGGDVLLVTDSVDSAARTAAQALLDNGIRVSVLGVGTEQGAALRDGNGALVYDRAGVPQLAQLDESGLRLLASAGGGRYARLQADGGDLHQLGLLNPESRSDASLNEDSAHAQRWRDEGIWLLPLLLLVALPGFRRGGLMTVFAVLLLPATPARAVDWDALWHNREQRADAALHAGDNESARRLASDPQRIGAAAYRAEAWDAAIEAFAKGDDAVANYNRGNALAQAKRYDEALAAYDRALEMNPKLRDASENRAVVEQLKQQRDASNQQQDGERDSDQQAQNDKADGEPGESDDAGESPGKGDPGDAGKPGNSAPSEQSGDSSDQPASPQAGDEQTGDAEGEPPSSGNQGTPDAKAEQQAQEALSDAMAKALEDAAANDDAAQDTSGREQRAGAATLSPEQREQQEQAQAVEAALRRVPDDPGGLLRRKFVIEYQRREAEGEER